MIDRKRVVENRLEKRLSKSFENRLYFVGKKKSVQIVSS